MTDDDAGRRRQLILVSALPFGPYPGDDRLRANCCRVLRGAMGRVGLWSEAMRHACHGEPELLNPTFTLWYDTLIAMTRPMSIRRLLLRGGGNLDLPSGAYFTCCHLTRAGRRTALDVLTERPEWRPEPKEPA